MESASILAITRSGKIKERDEVTMEVLLGPHLQPLEHRRAVNINFENIMRTISDVLITIVNTLLIAIYQDGAKSFFWYLWLSQHMKRVVKDLIIIFKITDLCVYADWIIVSSMRKMIMFSKGIVCILK